MYTTPNWRSLALVCSLIALITGSFGCATKAVIQSVKRVDVLPPKPVLTNEIFAIAQVDPALAQQVGKKQLVALLGMKNTYFLSIGGGEILRLSQIPELDPKKLRLVTPNNKGDLFLSDQTVWGAAHVHYDARGTELSASERQALDTQGFFAYKEGQQETGLFRKSFYIKGFVNPAISLNPQQNQILTANRYPLTLYAPSERREHTSPAALLLVPVGVVVDVLLAPVYLGGIAMAWLTLPPVIH